MTRDDVIDEIYRSLRDAFNSLDDVRRDGNKVLIWHGEHRAEVSFRVKLHHEPRPEGDEGNSF